MKLIIRTENENNFNWISPVEEITSGFIANLT